MASAVIVSPERPQHKTKSKKCVGNKFAFFARNENGTWKSRDQGGRTEMLVEIHPCEKDKVPKKGEHFLLMTGIGEFPFFFVVSKGFGKRQKKLPTMGGLH